ncbi:Ribose import ATP-binding protein RbsA [Rubripirellula lacrimiformis]|uniref:Ribose import ATP-binding protein RbsA n=1 Tax=Rubripirellula lacrimiformis TaxID=1930273 RepID=A0A517N7Z6_9BACT|nr:sugar ABC transporter ATP-binding protein [Rubripirellula lacrimiformis]QDT03128.1 Ribose import ATP-binding protein RbsA [Rubripirellula lacrimiformis]
MNGVLDEPIATPDRLPPLLSVCNINKRFAGVKALTDVSLEFAHGEVHAVIGENGAGKSTMMKILAGVQPPDEGQILLDGRPVKIPSVETALDLGIALIHQELNLADNLDVGANIFLGREPLRLGLIDFKRIESESRKFLAMVGLDIEPKTLVKDLTIGLQQLVEIAKALSVDARVLIMDEPTSSLSQHETEKLFTVIEDLRNRGVTVIYISHRLREIETLADRVSVLRDGQNAGGLSGDEITHDAMVTRMVGRDISQFYAREDHCIGDVVLSIEGLQTQMWPDHAATLQVRQGEMVGLAGLVGAGRTEILRAIFGIDPPIAGTVAIDGKRIAPLTCRAAIDAGMALVPEDRKEEGLILEIGIRSNIGLPGLGRNQKAGGFLNRKQEIADSEQMIAEMNIKTPSDRQPVQFLSGGNQQKVVIGKWLSMHPKVLLMDEPTRGVDIGAKQEIYRLMEELAERGVAILFVSSEMEEVLSMSDRIIVLHEGQVTGELDRQDFSEEAIMQLATGHPNDRLIGKATN